MRKVLLLICILLGPILIVNFFQKKYNGETVRPVKKDYSKSILVVSSEKSNSITHPKMLYIPAIDVKTSIEEVGMDTEGNMATPQDVQNVAWYSLGYKPGENGNAVLAGHYDTKEGKPAIFWKLNQLKKGDKITIVDALGKNISFKVTTKEVYTYKSFPIEKVFGPSEKPQLNLITCGGEWDSMSNVYTERIVIYTELSIT